MSKRGFTLIELMVAIAILAILSALAITSYTYYKNKAKTKKLINLARACLQEAITKCMEDSSFNQFSMLDSCNRTQDTTYITNIQFNINGGCNQNLSVSVTGSPKGVTSILFNATCIYNYSRDEITCSFTSS